MKPLLDRVLLLALLLSSLGGCASAVAPGIRYAGGDGSAPSEAVVIYGAGTEAEIRAAEEAWIRQAIPGAQWESGSYVIGPCACRAVTVTLPDKTTRTLYFGISALGH